MKNDFINQYRKNIPKELQDCPQWILFKKIQRASRHG